MREFFHRQTRVQARVPGNLGTRFRGLGRMPWLLPEGQRAPSSPHVEGVLLGEPVTRLSRGAPRQGGLPGGGGTACRFLAPSPAGGGQCDTDSRTCPRARRGCPAPTLLGRDAPRSTRPARPVSRPLARPPGQPGGVAPGQPAPLMYAGAAVIGWALVTCGDCGGPGCCGCRSARRGSGSGSPAFKGDAAAAPGMGGRWKGRSRSTSSTVPRGWRDS